MAAKKKSAPRAKAQAKVAKAMTEYKRGQLKSGGGAKVTSKKQAVAIGLNEARRAGASVAPPKKKAATGKKGTATKKKSANKNSSTKRR